MSKITTATLVKLATEDGLVEFNDDVPIGKVYKIDLSTLATVELWNTQRNISHFKEVVWDVRGGWLPTEVLSWEGKKEAKHEQRVD